jgi:hypothetical protein
MKRWLVLAFLVISLVGPGHAQEHPWYFTPRIGLSYFSGVIGFELQKSHWAFDIGLPLAGGVKYFFHPHSHGWFTGAYGAGWSFDNDETKDGVKYTDYSMISGGIGGGYRWFWKTRWSLELGLTAGYLKERWTNSSAWREERGLTIFPVATFGFSFR